MASFLIALARTLSSSHFTALRYAALIYSIPIKIAGSFVTIGSNALFNTPGVKNVITTSENVSYVKECANAVLISEKINICTNYGFSTRSFPESSRGYQRVAR
jgi:cellobiose-specific phosphotransferase system component IIC